MTQESLFGKTMEHPTEKPVTQARSRTACS